jgi:hypothetical protein
VIERGRDHAVRGDLDAGLGTGAGVQEPILDQVQHRTDRLGVRGLNGALDGSVSEGPQHACRLRHRERQVVAGHRGPGRVRGDALLDRLDRGRPRLLGELLGQAGDRVGNPLLRRPERRVGTAQLVPGHRVVPGAEQRGHRRLGNHHPRTQLPGTERGQPATQPPTRRIPARRVVRRQRLPGNSRDVRGRGVAQQVPVPRPRRQPRQRHHAGRPGRSEKLDSTPYMCARWATRFVNPPQEQDV